MKYSQAKRKVKTNKSTIKSHSIDAHEIHEGTTLERVLEVGNEFDEKAKEAVTEKSKEAVKKAEDDKTEEQPEKDKDEINEVELI